jgi:hypothetical protein
MGRARIDLFFVNAFVTRKDLTKFLAQISWETEVWICGDTRSSGPLLMVSGFLAHNRFLGIRNVLSLSIDHISAPKANRMDWSASAPLAHWLQNHRSAGQFPLGALSARKFVQHASKWEAES